MTYFERAACRTTGFAIVAGLSAVPGLVLGLVLFIGSGDAGALALVLAGPIAALLVTSPLRWVFIQAARIPFSIIFVGPVLVGYFLFVKPAEWFALWKRWVFIME